MITSKLSVLVWAILKKAIGKELRYPKSLNGTSNRVLGKMNNQKTSGNPHLKGEKNDGPS